MRASSAAEPNDGTNLKTLETSSPEKFTMTSLTGTAPTARQGVQRDSVQSNVAIPKSTRELQARQVTRLTRSRPACAAEFGTLPRVAVQARIFAGISSKSPEICASKT